MTCPRCCKSNVGIHTCTPTEGWGRMEQEIERLRAKNEALRSALKSLLNRDENNTCQHHETHRGGAIWEICDTCGAKWADDEGGRPDWKDPPEWTEAIAALAAKEDE